jgi:FixJ family two-component response regulator
LTVRRGTLRNMYSVPKKLRIGVIDDDESVRTATASLLRAAGYTTAAFDSAVAFLAAGDPHRFACVVADIQMPGMGGIALADQLGHDEPLVPVILMTAKTEQEVHDRVAASRAACLLHKPFSSERLLLCLQIVLG